MQARKVWVLGCPLQLRDRSCSGRRELACMTRKQCTLNREGGDLPSLRTDLDLRAKACNVDVRGAHNGGQSRGRRGVHSPMQLAHRSPFGVCVVSNKIVGWSVWVC